MAQTQRVQGRATSVFTDEHGALCCVYHSTIVARKLADGRVELNTGGWKSVTTKTRMNQFANQFCSGSFAVFQKGFSWYVSGKGRDAVFAGDKFTVSA